ncbi:MAG: PSD1 and planctomycete cytochrome C domain-containing protein, partial [Planctomycetota bacterium]
MTAAEPEFPREQIDFFEKQVRPVLAAQCWNCHAEKKAESGLRLDSREAILRGGDRGEVVKPREAAASLLIHAVRRDGELQMPPNGRLSPEQVAALTKWIDLGLPWPRESSGSALSQAWRTHWAFQPVMKPSIPAIADDSSSQTPIDRFVLERLRAVNSSSSPRADRRTLIRRATFDLIGLPPTPEEVAEFEADPAPDAFDRLVDRLLASPKYGERWGRHWLDVARYSDTKGYVFFEEKSYPWAYTYRDYVIRSLNEDKPYDQFVLEQLAADLLVRADGELDRDKGKEEADARSFIPLSSSPSAQLSALGFLTVGSHFMGNVHDIVDDRIDVVARGLMGLTVTCARCHDHKYDPIPTADYYSLYGVFRSTTEPLVPPLFSPPNDTSDYRRFTIELALRQQQLDDFVTQKHSALIDGARTRVGEYLLAAKAANEKPPTDDFMLLADPGDLNPAMIVRWQAHLNKVEGRGLRVEGESQTGISTTHRVWGPWFELASLNEERFKGEAITVCERSGKEGGTQFNALVVKSVCGSAPPASLNEVAARYGELMKSIHMKWQAALREAVVLKRPAPERLADPEEEELRLELYGEAAPASVPLIFGWGFLSLLPDRASQGEYQKVLKEVEQWLIRGPGAPPRAMVLLDGESYDPRIFVRGNPNRLGDAVPRQFLSAIERDHRKPFAHGSGRLELARAIVDPANPLTARVMVNRVWQHHFGAGLVRTPGDFGMRSDPPTHPELLDWLSAEFVASVELGAGSGGGKAHQKGSG